MHANWCGLIFKKKFVKVQIVCSYLDLNQKLFGSPGAVHFFLMFERCSYLSLASQNILSIQLKINKSEKKGKSFLKLTKVTSNIWMLN